MFYFLCGLSGVVLTPSSNIIKVSITVFTFNPATPKDTKIKSHNWEL